MAGDTRQQKFQIDRRSVLLAGAALLLCRGAGAHKIEPAPISGFELPQPKALQPFVLRSSNGSTFSLDGLRGRWSLLFFGFTHCPDVCPTTLLQLQDTKAEIARQREPTPTQIVFVTIDPARDTAARIREYVGRFGPGVVGVLGSERDTRRFAEQLRVRYEIAGDGRPIKGDYLFDHTASVCLLGPDARLYAVFTLPLRPTSVAADVVRIHRQHRAAICPTIEGRNETIICHGRTA